MTEQEFEDQSPRMAQSHLERAYMEEYLRGLGLGFDDLRLLPTAQARELLRAASTYASMRLSEVESRSHLVEELHGGPPPM
ncbi:MAG: hypothetical protein RMK84_00825 [Oscillochloridaceae bacterium]|jgi:hypothetical protein|nr:hypothetical protein [Chloroflexaceae bacterium]MDW8388640.1 hypothetical protein [Oscillochloridaceae bacterium]